MDFNDLSPLDQALYLAIDKRRQACEESFHEFVRYFWNVIITEPMVDNWHIKYLCDELQKAAMRVINREPKLYDLLINVPPGSSKSTICSVMLNCWVWCKDPSIRFLTGSFKSSLSVRDCVKSREIMRSSRFQELWPNKVTMKSDMDLKTEYTNTKNGSRHSFSVEGGIIGEHGHIITIDDPLNPKKRASDNEKLNAIDIIKSLSTRKVDKDVALTIMIMQRLAQDDPAGYWLDNHENLFHICLPAEITVLENIKPSELSAYYVDKLLDPIRGSRKELNSLEKGLGSKDYAGQALQHPEAMGGTIFKREWFKFYRELPADYHDFKMQSWDTDFGKNAATSAGVKGILKTNGLYLTGLFEGSLEYPQLYQQVNIEHYADPANVILIEDKASGQSIIQQLRQQSTLPVIPITPTTDKIQRAHAESPYVEAGKVFLPENADWTKRFLDVVCGFPDVKRKDIVDAFTQLVGYAREHVSGKTTILTKKIKRELVRGF